MFEWCTAWSEIFPCGVFQLFIPPDCNLGVSSFVLSVRLSVSVCLSLAKPLTLEIPFARKEIQTSYFEYHNQPMKPVYGYLSATKHLNSNFWMVRDRDFIICMYPKIMKPIKWHKVIDRYHWHTFVIRCVCETLMPPIKSLISVERSQ